MTELFQAMGQMDNMTIGLWITGLMLLLVILGLRVAFAAAVAGFLGLVWIFSAKLGFEKGFIVAAKMAGTIPHSKVSSVALSLIPTFILIGFLAYHAGLTKALFEAAISSTNSSRTSCIFNSCTSQKLAIFRINTNF